MIPYARWWELVRSFFTEDFGKGSVLWWDGWHSFCSWLVGWVGFFWPKVNGVNSSGWSGSMMTRPMNIWSVGGVLIWLIVRGRKRASATSGALKIMGSCEWSIHPLFQSMLGWTAANHG